MKEETTWEKVQHESGYPHPIEEWTTVTHKIRRVARFDWELAAQAIAMNRPTKLGITGLDYIDYKNFEQSDPSRLTDRARKFLWEIHERLGVPAVYLSTSPKLEYSLVLPER